MKLKLILEKKNNKNKNKNNKKTKKLICMELANKFGACRGGRESELTFMTLIIIFNQQPSFPILPGVTKISCTPLLSSPN